MVKRRDAKAEEERIEGSKHGFADQSKGRDLGFGEVEVEVAFRTHREISKWWLSEDCECYRRDGTNFKGITPSNDIIFFINFLV